METLAALPTDIWQRTPPEAQAYIRSLEARLATLEAMVQALQEQNRTLREPLKQTSGNSSRPPPRDPPQHRRRKRPPSKHQRGAQPGHPGPTRRLLPVEDVDEIVPLRLDVGRGCHAPFQGDLPGPFRHQVIELPPLKPVGTAYQWHEVQGPACGECTRAPWLAGVPSTTYGPRVQAPGALCTGAYRLSKRPPGQVMDDLFGVPMSVGTLSQGEQATSQV
jgi:hypothetical protein